MYKTQSRDSAFVIVALCATGMVMIPSSSCVSSGYYTNEYQLKLREDSVNVVIQQASRFGLTYQGKIVSNIYSFVDPTLPGRMPLPTTEGNMHSLKTLLQSEILEVQKVVLDPVTLHIPDHSRRIAMQHMMYKREATFPKCPPYYGMQIEQAWASNFTGLGVTVAVVDNGVDVNHTDLKLNVNRDLSFNFFTKDDNVEPQVFPNYPELWEDYTDHGNNIAGLIAAEKGNGKCAAGVGFNASLVVLKAVQLSENPNVFRKGLNDLYIADALAYKNDKIDVYSTSINHKNQYREPKLALTEALIKGTTEGRQGKGCIYVFSAGDTQDGLYDCNVDPYANSVYTITIGSVGINGTRPTHALRCSCILASTLWGTSTIHNIPLVTTSHNNRCSKKFKGSSASAALASGMMTLLLQANPNLTWRDVQHLIVLTSSLDQLQDDNKMTSVNAVGLPYNPYFGFGLLDASALVSLASNWTNVSPRLVQTAVMTQCQIKLNTNTCDQKLGMAKIVFPPCEDKSTCISYTEHVVIHVNYTTIADHETELVLRSPAGTLSVLKSRKPDQKQGNEIQQERIRWNFQSVQFWGENPRGEWRLCISARAVVKSTRCYAGLGIHHVEITLYGVATISPYLQHLYRSKTEDSRAHSPRGGPNKDTCSDQVFEEGSNIKCHVPDTNRGRENAEQEIKDNWVAWYFVGVSVVIIIVGVVLVYQKL